MRSKPPTARWSVTRWSPGHDLAPRGVRHADSNLRFQSLARRESMARRSRIGPLIVKKLAYRIGEPHHGDIVSLYPIDRTVVREGVIARRRHVALSTASVRQREPERNSCRGVPRTTIGAQVTRGLLLRTRRASQNSSDSRNWGLGRSAKSSAKYRSVVAYTYRACVLSAAPSLDIPKFAASSSASSS